MRNSHNIVICAGMLLVVAYLHGLASGPPNSGAFCRCIEQARSLILHGDVNSRALAECMLHNRPTRGIMHGQMSRCVGRSSWHAPPRANIELTGRWPSKWSKERWSSSHSPFLTVLGRVQGDAAEGGVAADVEHAGDVDLGSKHTLADELTPLDLTTEHERAAKMLAAIQEHGGVESATQHHLAPTPLTADAAFSSPRPVISSTSGTSRTSRTSLTSLTSRTAAAEVTPVTEAGTLDDAEIAVTTASAEAEANSTTSAEATEMLKRVITYSLYGDAPKYVKGAVRNAELINSTFPGWKARYYIDLASVPSDIVASLRSLGAELVPIDMAKHGNQSMFWRFWAAADPTIERFISRDVDSRLMARDYTAVNQWVQSGLPFHVVRDHPSHSLYPMSGGLWGATRGALPQVMELIAAFPTDSKYLTDMLFLNHDVWPIAMRAGVLQHDAFTCVEFDDALAYPVTVDSQGFHVGQVFDAEDQGRQNDIDALLNAVQPDACKPGGDPTLVRKSRTAATMKPERECADMRNAYHVRPGVTWGSLPEVLHMRWARLACDGRVAAGSRSAAGVGGAPNM